MSDGASKAKPSSSSTFHLLAGLSSGLTTALLLQPADLLKTRVQQSPTHSLSHALRSILASPNPVKQLWRGALPSCIRTSAGSALYFSSLNAIRSSFARSGAFKRASPRDGSNVAPSTSVSSSALVKLNVTGNLVAGAVARASVGFLMMPITVIKVRFESNFYSYTSLAGAARDIVKNEGIRGLFAGFGATALRDAPYAGLYVVFYEGAKSRLGDLISKGWSGSRSGVDNREGMSNAASAATNFMSGALAAAGATTLTNPPDAIKTRLQVQPQRYRNTLQTLSLMLKEEGVRGLFDGLGLRIARKALSSALAWTVYEEAVRWAERRVVA